MQVALDYQPRKRGLIWHRTYGVAFQAEYVFKNPTAVTHAMELDFPLPGHEVRLEQFQFDLLVDGKPLPNTAERVPGEDVMRARVELSPGQAVTLKTAYEARGMDFWSYEFAPGSRIRDFELRLHTNFAEVDFPLNTGSPTTPLQPLEGGQWELGWRYEDVIAARGVGMIMPAEVNVGAVATRVCLFAPLSLGLFFGVLLLAGVVKKAELHPMNYLLLAAGFFAFPLLFAYSVDVLPVVAAFAVASAASMLLVGGYLRWVAGGKLFWIALPTQFFYLVLFSASFFLTGFTGLTLTVGGVVTLALLMAGTAQVNWAEVNWLGSWRAREVAAS